MNAVIDHQQLFPQEETPAKPTLCNAIVCGNDITSITVLFNIEEGWINILTRTKDPTKLSSRTFGFTETLLNGWLLKAYNNPNVNVLETRRITK